MSDTLERVAKILAELLGIDPAEATADADLENLGADSLDLFEIGMELEEEFGVVIADDHLQPVVDDGTVRALVTMVDARLAEKAAAA